VDGVGEIDRCGIFGELDDIALWRECKDMILEEIDLQAAKEFFIVSANFFLPFLKLADPFEPAWFLVDDLFLPGKEILPAASVAFGIVEELTAKGGKSQVPYIFDDATSIGLYDSKLILSYLEETYGKGGGCEGEAAGESGRRRGESGCKRRNAGVSRKSSGWRGWRELSGGKGGWSAQDTPQALLHRHTWILQRNRWAEGQCGDTLPA
jgi:hypothetical protein